MRTYTHSQAYISILRKKERKKEEKNKVAQNLLDDLGLRGRIQL